MGLRKSACASALYASFALGHGLSGVECRKVQRKEIESHKLLSEAKVRICLFHPQGGPQVHVGGELADLGGRATHFQMAPPLVVRTSPRHASSSFL